MKNLKSVLLVLVVVVAILASNCLYTVAENEYACTVRFSKIESVTNEAGLHFKIPFLDSVKYFTKVPVPVPADLLSMFSASS